jgi:hypothetical protein
MRESEKMGASIYHVIGYDDAWVLWHPCNEKLYIYSGHSGNVIIISAYVLWRHMLSPSSPAT